MTCLRCGMDTPRLTVDQRYDPRCAREVQQVIDLDAKRRTRFPFGKALSGGTAA